MALQQLPSLTQNRNNKREVIIPIIQDKLYWICSSLPPKNSKNSIYFCIDEELIYEPLNNDFGPFCIENTLNFIKSVEALLSNPAYANTTIYHYTSSEQPEKKVNSAFLICAYQLLCLNRTSAEIWQKFKNVNFITFRDSSDIKNDYKCTLLDCLRGLEYAYKLNWISNTSFDLQQYQALKAYDITVVIPNKLIAFQNPELFSQSDTTCELTVDQSISIFKQMGVKLVIRLNNSQYSSQLYERNGIKHRDLIFPDGSSPSEEIMQSFLQEVESVDGMVAVHCKAGRGRTGTLIGCYAMKHYHFPSKDFIGYIRVMRPGSIHGPQQPFLNHVERNLLQNYGGDSEIWASVKHLVEPECNEKKLFSASTLALDEGQKQKQVGYARNRINSLCLSKQQQSTPQSFKQQEEQSPSRNNQSLSKGSTLNEGSTASSGSSGVKSQEDYEQVKDFSIVAEKYLVPPLQNKQSRKAKHLRNISAYYPKTDSFSSSYLNSSSNQINQDLSSINNLQYARGNRQNYELLGKNRIAHSNSKSSNRRIIVGRKQFEEENNPSSHSFYGMDQQDSSYTLSKMESKKNRVQANSLTQNDIIFNNLCKLQNKQVTKAEENLNKTWKENHFLNKNLINRKNYIIKQYSKAYAQIY